MVDPVAPPRDVFGTHKGTGTVSWFHRNPALSNQYCHYCRRLVGASSTLDSEKEHLVARNMGAQLDRDKIKLLAFRHIQGLFSLLTSENPRVVETTRLLPGVSKWRWRIAR